MVQKKLKSRRGASILLAMVFLLVCLGAGAMILTAASANAGRAREARENEQSYLTASSAALLLREKLSGLTYTKVQVTETADGLTGYPKVTGPTHTVSHGGDVAYLAQNLETALAAADSSDQEVPFTLSVTDLEAVEGTLTVHTDLSITASLAVAGSGRAPMVFTLSPYITESTVNTQGAPVSIEYQVEEDNPAFDPSQPEDPETNPSKITVTVNDTVIPLVSTYSKTVTWSGGQIQQDAAAGGGSTP